MDQAVPVPVDQPYARINVDAAWEVKLWCVELGCTEQRLREVVACVGPVVKDVVRELANSAMM